MKYLIYYVAAGEKHRALAALSIRSLYLTGYTGDVHVLTDGDLDHGQPEDKVTVETSDTLTVWQAKRQKAQKPLRWDVSEYSAVLFLDADTLATRDVTPILQRIEWSPNNLFMAHTSNRRLLAVRGLAETLTDAEKATVPVLQPMLDSYAVGFVPNEKNLDLLKQWGRENAEASSIFSDALTLNLAVIRAGRLGAVEFMVECERLNGTASERTVIEHYVHGQHVRMPLIFADRFKGV